MLCPYVCISSVPFLHLFLSRVKGIMLIISNGILSNHVLPLNNVMNEGSIMFFSSYVTFTCQEDYANNIKWKYIKSCASCISKLQQDIINNFYFKYESSSSVVLILYVLRSSTRSKYWKCPSKKDVEKISALKLKGNPEQKFSSSNLKREGSHFNNTCLDGMFLFEHWIELLTLFEVDD